MLKYVPIFFSKFYYSWSNWLFFLPFFLSPMKTYAQQEPSGPGRAIRPVLECIYKKSDGSLVALFGYLNENQSDVRIPVGDSNKFSPQPIDRRQVTLFKPGRQYGVYVVPYRNGNQVWTIKSPDGSRRTATAGPNPSDAALCRNDPMPEPLPEQRCGDGVVNGGETCDGNCPTSCDDANACTTDLLVGSANKCNVSCQYENNPSNPGCIIGCEDIFTSSDCPDGYVCDRTNQSVNSYQCRLRGHVPEGSPCTEATDCGSGLTCYDFGAPVPGKICRKFCSESVACGQGKTCFPNIFSQAGLCTDNCTPGSGSGCSDPMHCGIFRNQDYDLNFKLCHNYNDLNTPNFQSCKLAPDCKYGSSCIAFIDSPKRECRKLCNVTAQESCPNGKVCKSFNTPFVSEGVEWGTCPP